MKLLIIGTVASSFYGFRKDLILELIKKGHTVYAFTTDSDPEELEKIEGLGAIAYTYPLSRSGLNPINDIKATYFLTRKIKKLQPDIVLSYFAKPVIFGTFAAKIANTPKIVGMIEGLGYYFTDQPYAPTKKNKYIQAVQILLYKIALPQLDDVIFLNPDDPIDLVEKYDINIKRLHILGGIGLNLEDYKYQTPPSIKASINFLFIGRLLKEKGIYDFINAAKIVKERYPSASFTVLGSIDKANPGALSEQKLEALISSNIINHPGYVSNVSEWVSNCHVFVLPSYREGVPRSTQEAMAIGRPIITTDVPGCRETVVQGINGFLVEKWNPKALAEKMIYFINNPDKIEKMGFESYKMAEEKFDVNKVNKKLLKILGL